MFSMPGRINAQAGQLGTQHDEATLQTCSDDFVPRADADEGAEDGIVAAGVAAAKDVQAALIKRVLPALAEQLIVKNEVCACSSPDARDSQSHDRHFRLVSAIIRRMQRPAVTGGSSRKNSRSHLTVQVVRAPVALAMVKLLRLLPAAAAQAQLPRTLQGVANLLRNRLQRFR